MPSRAIEIADFLIDRAISDENSDLLTNLKLQKLLYYAEGYHLVLFDESLFDDKIEAWEMGPVVPNVYHVFKPCGRRPIEEMYGDESNLSIEYQRFLVWICAEFGKYSANRLVTMTHKEPPWFNSMRRGQNTEISRSEIREFFANYWSPKTSASSARYIVNDDLSAEISEAISEVDGRPGMSAKQLLEALEL